MLPEAGLVIMVGMGITGLVLKFKLSSIGTRKKMFKLHTSPIFMICLVMVLVTGHALMH